MNKLSDSEKIALGKRLTLFRNALKMTQEEFGNAIGKGRTTVFSWEKGKTQPPEHYIGVIEKATWNHNGETVRINPHWLETGEGEMFLKVVHKIFEDAGPEGEESFKAEKIAKLRSEVRKVSNKFYDHPGIRVWALAGGGDPWEPDNNEPMEIIETSALLSPKYRDSFRVWGDSMEPVIRHNALVFCDFNDKRIRGGEIYALNIPSEGLVVKELRIQKDHVIVYSYNELRYPPFYYTHEEINQGHIIVGRIVLIHQETNK